MSGSVTVFVFDAGAKEHADAAKMLVASYLDDRLCQKVGAGRDALVPFAVWEPGRFETINASAKRMLAKIQEEPQIGTVFFYERPSGRVFECESGGLRPWAQGERLDVLELAVKKKLRGFW